MNNLYLDYAAIILVVVGFCIGYGVFITPQKLAKILADREKECSTACKDAYVTKEDMQIERKELLQEVERRFLEKVAFEQFTKRFDDKFETMAKTLDKVVENQEHIKDYIIQKKGL
jgi:adenylate kinase family enzyme